MMIEYLTTDKRAGSFAKQQAAIRSDGTLPVVTMTGDDIEYPTLFFRDNEDTLALSHARALGDVRKARRVLVALARAGVKIKLPDCRAMDIQTPEQVGAFLVEVAKPWGTGTKKQTTKGMGRPPKHRQPSAAEKDAICGLWNDPKNKRPAVRAVASGLMGYPVQDWQLKQWCGDKRVKKKKIGACEMALFAGLDRAEPVKMRSPEPFKTQLLKWIGNKQKFAHEIIGHFPAQFGAYYEPFLGAGGVMATLAPTEGYGSDVLAPLVEIWTALAECPDELKQWYASRWETYQAGDRVAQYEKIKASYNANPNGADLLFLARSCFGGVVRFRKHDGYMSTPIGAHQPINPDAFSKRVETWQDRLKASKFHLLDYTEAMARAKSGDLVYCDPPYSHSQAILYGAQSFSLAKLMEAIEDCKRRGVYVVLSIDGTKKSGNQYCDIDLPEGLFEQELMVNVGRSMLKRFQMGGQGCEAEEVRDRLLLTY